MRVYIFTILSKTRLILDQKPKQADGATKIKDFELVVCAENYKAHMKIRLSKFIVKTDYFI